MSDEFKISDPTYQDKDIKLTILSISLIATGVVILVAFLTMRSLYNSYEKKYAAANPPSPLTYERILPPAPRLQVNEPEDWAAYYEQEQAVLNAHRVVDEATGIGRVPIEEAKQIVVKRGLAPLVKQGAN
jgi:hypothetical protein